MFKGRMLHLIKQGGQHLVTFKVSEFFALTLSRCVLTSLYQGIHHCCTSVSLRGGHQGTTWDYTYHTLSETHTHTHTVTGIAFLPLSIRNIRGKAVKSAELRQTDESAEYTFLTKK